MQRRIQIAFKLMLLGTVLLTSHAGAEGLPGGAKKIGLMLFGGFSFTSHQGTGLNGGLNGTTGMAFGFGLDYRLTKEIAVEIDVLDIWKSYEETGATTDRYNLAYLELPFLLKYSPAPWISLKAGPYLAAFIMAAERESGGTSSGITGNFQNDFGLTFGTWINLLTTKSMNIGIDARYDLGMNNILNDNEPTRRVSTRTFITMLTLTFFLK